MIPKKDFPKKKMPILTVSDFYYSPKNVFPKMNILDLTFLILITLSKLGNILLFVLHLFFIIINIVKLIIFSYNKSIKYN